MNFDREWMDETTRAYLAGLVDGEGSITIRKTSRQRTNTHQYSLQLVIANTSLKLSKWMSVLGIKGYIWNRNAINQNPKWRLSFTYHFNGKEARDLLWLLLPYLVIKPEQARLGINFCEVKGFHQGYRPSPETIDMLEIMYQQMSDLNHSDYIIPEGGD